MVRLFNAIEIARGWAGWWYDVIRAIFNAFRRPYTQMTVTRDTHQLSVVLELSFLPMLERKPVWTIMFYCSPGNPIFLWFLNLVQVKASPIWECMYSRLHSFGTLLPSIRKSTYFSPDSSSRHIDKQDVEKSKAFRRPLHLPSGRNSRIQMAIESCTTWNVISYSPHTTSNRLHHSRHDHDRNIYQSKRCMFGVHLSYGQHQANAF